MQSTAEPREHDGRPPRRPWPARLPERRAGTHDARRPIRVVGRPPNIDLALAALAYVGGIDPTAPLFAIARIAGWAAHLAEELAERPVRYRGLARQPG